MNPAPPVIRMRGMSDLTFDFDCGTDEGLRPRLFRRHGLGRDEVLWAGYVLVASLTISSRLRQYGRSPPAARASAKARIRGNTIVIGVLGEAHLRRILRAYARYYNDIRTNRSLDKDASASRPVQRTGIINSHAILGGLHHHYVRV
jgi:hypothetical protein